MPGVFRDNLQVKKILHVPLLLTNTFKKLEEVVYFYLLIFFSALKYLHNLVDKKKLKIRRS